MIVGVKEIPVGQVVPGKSHICFSHTHKGQPAGAPLLAAMMDSKASLMDYELLTDDNGARVLAFGKYAGYAGMINCLHGLGDRILQLGFRTPFLNIGLAHHYPSLAAAKRAVQLVAKEVEKHGLPAELGPLSFVFTGQGNVSTVHTRPFIM
jgi:alpha-aminoadipic semialdehyde synthase